MINLSWQISLVVREINFQELVELSKAGLVLLFKREDNLIDIHKLAMWRLRVGDISWVSDYVINYRGQHG